MRYKTLDVYPFSELQERVQEKVLEKFRYNFVEFNDWYQDDLIYWKDQLSESGFENADIRFSGFYSQGDGASFTASIDLSKIIAQKPEYAPLLKADFEIRIESVGSSRYSHEHTKRIEFAYYGSDEAEMELIEKFEKYLEGFREDFCHKIYYSLRSEYEHLTSDENIKEFFEMNEYEFTIDGKLV